jgi:hypothetical protein
MKKILNLLISLSFISLFGNITGADNTATKASTAAPASTTMTLYCPAPSQLTLNKNNHHWEARPHWLSFDTSFITKPTTFVGAQWQGVDLGQVFCLYNNKAQSDFPIILYFDTQVPKPLSGSWHQPSGNNPIGYLDCSASDHTGCAFTVVLKAKSTKSVYQQAEELKKSPAKTNPNP